MVADGLGKGTPFLVAYVLSIPSGSVAIEHEKPPHRVYEGSSKA